MCSTFALEAKEKYRERKNRVGPKFDDMSMYMNFLRWFQLAQSTQCTMTQVTGLKYFALD